MPKSKNHWNPKGLPSPAELGYREGSFVYDVAFPSSFGVCVGVFKNHVTVAFEGCVMSCHPTGRFEILPRVAWCQRVLDTTPGATTSRKLCSCGAKESDPWDMHLPACTGSPKTMPPLKSFCTCGVQEQDAAAYERCTAANDGVHFFGWSKN